MSAYISGWEDNDKLDNQDVCSFVTYSSPNNPIVSPLNLEEKSTRPKFYIPFQKKPIKNVRKKILKDCSLIKLNSTFINLESKISLHQKLVQKYGKNRQTHLLRKQKMNITLQKNKSNNFNESDSKFTIIDLIDKVQLNDKIKKVNQNRKKFFTICNMHGARLKNGSKLKGRSNSLHIIDILTKNTSEKRELSPLLRNFYQTKLQFPNLMCKSYKSSSEHRKSFSDAKLIR